MRADAPGSDCCGSGSSWGLSLRLVSQGLASSRTFGGGRWRRPRGGLAGGYPTLIFLHVAALP
jgi:hypothetical protein